MKLISQKAITKYVEDNIETFHQKRIARLGEMKLKTIIAQKNPYLFKAKHVLTAQDIVKKLTDAFISSQEETIFGDWLEGLAIFANRKVLNGRKSGIPGIDLEFDKDDTRYIITIKSGPKWGNSSQISKMKADFSSAKKTLRTSNSQLNVVAINGCCYGRDNKPDKGDYFKFCGQRFWEFITGDSEFYIKIIEPLGYQAKEKNENYIQSYSQMINKFTKEFANTFCLNNGSIDWNKLVQFNSMINKPK